MNCSVIITGQIHRLQLVALIQTELPANTAAKSRLSGPGRSIPQSHYKTWYSSWQLGISKLWSTKNGPNFGFLFQQDVLGQDPEAISHKSSNTKNRYCTISFILTVLGIVQRKLQGKECTMILISQTTSLAEQRGDKRPARVLPVYHLQGKRIIE